MLPRCTQTGPCHHGKTWRVPIPGLDGCKLLFLAAEGITRRELPLRFQTAINAAGMILLLMLMVLTTMQDVAKYIL